MGNRIMLQSRPQPIDKIWNEFFVSFD